MASGSVTCLRSRGFCAQALEKYNIEKDIAAFIKKEFDKKYNPTWHCIVGRNFGARPTLPSTCMVPMPLPKHARPCTDAAGRSPCRLLRHPRNQALHLLLPWWVKIFAHPLRWFPVPIVAKLAPSLSFAGQVAILLFKSG